MKRLATMTPSSVSSKLGGHMAIDKSLFTKEVIAPFTGQVFTIHRVDLMTMIEGLGVLSLPVAASVQDALSDLQEKVKADPAVEAKARQFLVTNGVDSPQVWFGEKSECPADQVYHLYLGSDLRLLANEIMTYSYGVQVSACEHFFFQQNRARNSGLNGAEVRPEAIEPAT